MVTFPCMMQKNVYWLVLLKIKQVRFKDIEPIVNLKYEINGTLWDLDCLSLNISHIADK